MPRIPLPLRLLFFVVALVPLGLMLGGEIPLLPALIGVIASCGAGTVVMVIDHGMKKEESSWKLQAKRIKELTLGTRSIRRTGRVRDVIIDSSRLGGPILHDEGVRLLVRVELPRESGSPEVATCYLIEDSEKGRARIGTEITILQHPDDPNIKAIEGYDRVGKRLA